MEVYMASICGSPVCAGGKPKMKFTYTGDYVVRKDGVVELLTSGTIVFLEPKVIDLFMVGGGAMGAFPSQSISTPAAFGGGAGGYTRTVRKINVAANESFAVTIGAGGKVGARAGGSSGWGAFTVEGGKDAVSANARTGGIGGSGGGGSAISYSDGGSGGSDGNNGENATYGGGGGQGFTTREFGEATGKLYAGGGGGGRYIVSNAPVVSMGGAGGGGAGGWQGSDKSVYQAPAAGGANTGGGGGGGFMADITSPRIDSASGGSGIVCLRESLELPELAGTWVMTNRIYQPATTIKELVNFTMPGYTVTSYNAKGVIVAGLPTAPASIFGIWRSTDVTEQDLSVYDFYSNKWGNTKDLQPAVLTFPSGATASEEFRAWLASNATKQA